MGSCGPTGGLLNCFSGADGRMRYKRPNWRDRFVRTTREDLVPPTGHGPRARSDPPAASPSGSSSSSSPASIYADAAAAAAPTRVVPVVGKTERATPQVAVPVATGVCLPVRLLLAWLSNCWCWPWACLFNHCMYVDL